MLDDIREQRDRWQQQAERLAALAITDQKEPAPARPQSWWFGWNSPIRGVACRYGQIHRGVDTGPGDRWADYDEVASLPPPPLVTAPRCAGPR
jgi:hypothetical protein